MEIGRIALIAMTMIGMAACGAGVGKVAAHNAWLHPPALISMALGALALWIVGAVLLGARVPVVTGDMGAALVVVGIIVAKVALTRVHGLPAS